MKEFFRTFFATLLSLIVIFLLVVGIAAALVAGDKVKIEDHSYLVLDIYGTVTEYDPPGGILAELTGESAQTLQKILDSLAKAKVDDRIEGVILKLSATNTLGGAMMEEIRRAIHDVRDSGKKVYGFADTIDRKTYFVAAACDSFFMPRTAYIGFHGFGVTSTHFKGTLEKLGVRPNLHKIKDYKSAAEAITRKDMSGPARENIQWLLDDVWDVYMATFQEERGFTEAKVNELMERALYSAAEAHDAGLIDGVLYWDELEDRLKGEEDELLTVSQEDYGAVEMKELGLTGEKKIAVVHAEGSIGGRESRVDPLLGVMMGHESVVSDLKEAREDEDVVAIVFRVASPGGEGLASDLIGHEVKLTAEKMPVVVSMVDVAASGGYHVSYRATKIVADPLTITGSIGSISGKFNIKEFHNKLGITHDFEEKGPNALFWSSQRDFTEEEWERFTENHWESFNDWLRDVADHRGMSFEEAEKLAHGRVWTGRQALENGLVDEVGGLDRAVALARELAEVPEEEKVAVVHYPEREGILEAILSGNLDLTTVVRWMIYRVIREDLAETWNLVAGDRPVDRIDFRID